MAIRSIVVVAIRVLALVTFAVAIRALGFSLDPILRGGLNFSVFLQTGGANVVLLTVLALALWVGAPTLADRLVRDAVSVDEAPPDTEPVRGIRPIDVQAIATAVLGLWLIAQGLSSAGVALAAWAQSRQVGDSPLSFDGSFFRMQAVTEIGRATLLLVAGTVFIWAAYGLSDAIQGMWDRRDRIVRARRVELVDEIGDVRGLLSIGDEGELMEVSALTLFDGELRPRVRAGTPGRGEPTVVVFDEDGTTRWSAP